MAKQLYEKIGNEYKAVQPIVDIQNVIDSESNSTLASLLNKYNYISLIYDTNAETTRNTVPTLIRRRGLIICYYNGTEWISEKYIGDAASVSSSWSDDSNWEVVPDKAFVQTEASKIPNGAITLAMLSSSLQEAIAAAGNITNLPDDEDLTEVNSAIRFKDREYNADLASGKGYVILRKNWLNVNDNMINVLTQDMISKENTIYEIRYDFDLNSQSITIPENSILYFKGGSISNGNIVYNNNIINGNGYIFKNISFSGTLNNSELRAEWFGVDYSNDDNTKYINNTVIACQGTNVRRIIFNRGFYKILGQVNLGSSERVGWDIIIQGAGANENGLGTTFYIGENGLFYGNMSNYNYGSTRSGAIMDCCFQGQSVKKGIGIVLDYSMAYTITRCAFTCLKYGIILTGGAYFTNITNCRFAESEYGIVNPSVDMDYYKEGDGNNNLVSASNFTYVEHPIEINIGQGWHIKECDSEGANGTIVLGTKNNMTNFRIERNLDDVPWLKIDSGCYVDCQIHSTLNTDAEVRCIVEGDNNNINIITSTDITKLLTSYGKNNKFNFIMLSGEIIVDVDDDITINGYSNKHDYLGQNLFSTLIYTLNTNKSITYNDFTMSPISSSYVRTSVVSDIYTVDDKIYETCKLYIESDEDIAITKFSLGYNIQCKTNKWLQHIVINDYGNDVPISVSRLYGNIGNQIIYLTDACLGIIPLFNRPVMYTNEGKTYNPIKDKNIKLFSTLVNYVRYGLSNTDIYKYTYTNILGKTFKRVEDSFIMGKYNVEGGIKQWSSFGNYKYALIYFFDYSGNSVTVEYRRSELGTFPEQNILMTSGNASITACNKDGVVSLDGFEGTIYQWIEYSNTHVKEFFPTIAFSGQGNSLIPTDINNNDVGYTILYNNIPRWWTGREWVDAYGNSSDSNRSGLNTQRPSVITMGFIYFDFTLNKFIFWNETKWVDAQGEDADILYSGTSANRPTPTNIGFQYFDTNLNKPIWWTGSDWVDANGNDPDASTASDETSTSTISDETINELS